MQKIGPPASSGLKLGYESQGAGFSPDGRMIAFVAATGGRLGIYAMGSDGSAPSQVLLSPSAAWGESTLYKTPSFLPNGEEILFSSVTGFGPEYGISAVRLDGSGVRRLTNPAGAGGQDLYAHAAPNGEQIIFTKIRSRGGTIFLMNADGSGQIALTSPLCDTTAGGFSPDGSEIAVSRNCGKKRRSASIYTMRTDGSHLRRLTHAGRSIFDTDPSFSPDGSRIVFARRRRWPGNNASEIDTVALDGSRLHRVARSQRPAFSGAPIWQPLPTAAP